jgi:plastocyanin
MVGAKGIPLLGLGTAVIALVLAVIALVLPGPAFLQVPAAEGATTREFLMSSDAVEGSNRFHPATLHAFDGDAVVLRVTNRTGIVHGFTVAGLGIQDTLEPGESKEYRIEAAPAGLYRYYCHLHPGHIGGQLVVLSR